MKFLTGLFACAAYMLVAPVVALICTIVNIAFIVAAGGQVKFNCGFERRNDE